MKRKINPVVAFCTLVVLFIAFSSCNKDDEDDFGHHAKYPFVGNTYVRQWTLQNTTNEYQFVVHFSTDSTFTLTSIKVETGEKMNEQPAEGKYVVEEDGSLTFSGVVSYNTKIKGRALTFYQGKFENDDQKTLKIYGRVEFSSGNSNVGWWDYELQ